MNTLCEHSLQHIEKYLLEVLGDDPIENRGQNYIKALKGIGVDGMRRFILSLLENGIPESIVSNSYFHPNKFFKLGICRLSNNVKLRLHFWNKDQLEVQTPIHFHAWDFASMLISGSYTHDIFHVRDLDEETIALIERYRNSENIPFETRFENYFGMYKIPKRNKMLGKFQPEWVKYVQAEKASSKLEKQGSIYFLDMEHPHQITIDLKEVGSMITLVLTSETHPDNVFTFQPIKRAKIFDNPSPNVDESIVRKQLEIILSEIDKTIEANLGQKFS